MRSLLISGISGKIGLEVKKLATNYGFNIICGIDNNSFIDANFPIYKSFFEVKNQVDVIVDFSSPTLCDRAVDFALENNCKFVSGTTALSDLTKEKIKRLSRITAVCLSSNFSIGIPVYNKAIGFLKRSLNEFDVSMSEIHNKNKKDSPSGTAKQICGENGIDCVLSIRGGSIPGTHTTYFLGNGEEIEITHRAYDKSVFAHGALKCANKLLQIEKGLFASFELMQTP